VSDGGYIFSSAKAYSYGEHQTVAGNVPAVIPPERDMAADYDAPRNTTEDDGSESIQGFKERGGQKVGLVADLDDGDTSGGFELDAPDLEATVDVVVLPIQENEFTCVECFLVRPRLQMDHQSKLGPVCIECAY